jgi:hypothetical protein
MRFLLTIAILCKCRLSKHLHYIYIHKYDSLTVCFRYTTFQFFQGPLHKLHISPKPKPQGKEISINSNHVILLGLHEETTVRDVLSDQIITLEVPPKPCLFNSTTHLTPLTFVVFVFRFMTGMSKYLGYLCLIWQVEIACDAVLFLFVMFLTFK